MDIIDFNGQKITEGTTLKYIGTRTKGKADKICFMEDNTWIRLDSTGLYYRLDYLMVIEEENKRRTFKKSNKEKILQRLKQTSHKNYEISRDSDGPGVGGG
ncbi:MAG: DUF2098 domain-containing protein [Methanobacterium sp.]|nr:DUF2098 domain-containing protein [Methanobacterium sp.]